MDQSLTIVVLVIIVCASGISSLIFLQADASETIGSKDELLLTFIFYLFIMICFVVFYSGAWGAIINKYVTQSVFRKIFYKNMLFNYYIY